MRTGSHFWYAWYFSAKVLARWNIVLQQILSHIFSIEFWRLFAFLAKRFMSVDKLLGIVPFFFTPLMYFFHCLRAGLRVFNYFYKTKNKNLGETRKLLFAIFKVLIGVIAFVLCFTMPVPAVLLTGFLLYSVLKLIDSAHVFVFSIAAHFILDSHSVENQWRRTQYWANLQKHLSMLAPGIATTCLTGIILGLGLSNPVMLCALAITTLISVTSFAYLGGLIYRYYRSKTLDTKIAYAENIKKFTKLFLFWLFCCLLIDVGFLIPAGPALGVIIGLLFLFYVYDIIISVYFYFKKNTDYFEVNYNLIEENSLADDRPKCYYGSRNPLFFLKQNTPVSVAKETLVYIYALKNKLRKWEEQKGVWVSIRKYLEKTKLEIKIKGLVCKLSELLKDGKNDHVYLNSLFVLLKEVQKKLAAERDSLAGKRLNLNTIENINNLNWFNKDLIQLEAYQQAVQRRKRVEKLTSGTALEYEANPHNSNVLLDLYLAGLSNSNEIKPLPKAFYQSFFCTEGSASLLGCFIDKTLAARKQCVAENPAPAVAEAVKTVDAVLAHGGVNSVSVMNSSMRRCNVPGVVSASNAACFEEVLLSHNQV